MIVQEQIADRLCSAVQNVFEEAGKGLGANPLDMTTQHGPVVDKLQFERIMSYIEKGRHSAQLITGGARKGTKGYFVEPTLFLNPNRDSPIWNEEIFGPVLTMKTFKTEEEAIQLANDSLYGLACKYFIRNPHEMHLLNSVYCSMHLHFRCHTSSASVRCT